MRETSAPIWHSRKPHTTTLMSIISWDQKGPAGCNLFAELQLGTLSHLKKRVSIWQPARRTLILPTSVCHIGSPRVLEFIARGRCCVGDAASYDALAANERQIFVEILCRLRLKALSPGNGDTMNESVEPRIALYAGSFDPITLGHRDIIARGARIFHRLVVGVGVNPDKRALFTVEERIALIESVLNDFDNVTVSSFEGLTVNFANECGAIVMLRGVRTLSDMESEFTMSLANRALAPDIETMFLMANEKYSHISSTLIKQIARMGAKGDAASLRKFLPESVVEPMLEKFNPPAEHP